MSENILKEPISSIRIKHIMLAIDGLSVLLIIYILFRGFKSWFLLAPIIGDNFLDIFGFCIAAAAVLSIPVFGRLQNYYENDHKPIFNLGANYGAIGNSIARILLAGFIFACYLTTVMPHASTYFVGDMTVRTFDVEWVQGKGRNCSGYKIVGRSWVTHNRFCRLSPETITNVRKTNTLEIQGVENAFGFRAIKIVT